MLLPELSNEEVGERVAQRAAILNRCAHLESEEKNSQRLEFHAKFPSLEKQYLYVKSAECREAQAQLERQAAGIMPLSIDSLTWTGHGCRCIVEFIHRNGTDLRAYRIAPCKDHEGLSVEDNFAAVLDNNRRINQARKGAT